MSSPTTRSTIYFEPDLHQALRLQAAATHRSVSDLVNAAVRESLAENRQDLAISAQRVAEPTVGHVALRRGVPHATGSRTAPVATKLVPPTGDTGWDAWFDGPAASADFMPRREQPDAQVREAL